MSAASFSLISGRCGFTENLMPVPVRPAVWPLGREFVKHQFEDAGYVTNMNNGKRVYLQNCTACLLTTASDIPYDPECDGVPNPVRQKIYDMTEGLRPEIAAALGF